jgi:hypothetical protein
MSTAPVHVRIGEHTVLVVAEELGARPPGDEVPVGVTAPDFAGAVRAAAAAADDAATAFLQGSCSSLSVEFALEFAVESGTLLAILGKASSSSSMKVVATYSRPSDAGA